MNVNNKRIVAMIIGVLILSLGCTQTPYEKAVEHNSDFQLLKNTYPNIPYYVEEEQKDISDMRGTSITKFWTFKMYENGKYIYGMNFSRYDEAKEYLEGNERSYVGFKGITLILVGKTREEVCINTNDITSYGLGNPIRIASNEELREYKEVKVGCSSCEKCGEVKRIMPVVLEKDGNYYIYAEEIVKEQDKNNCNIYTTIKIRLFPINSVKINLNKDCKGFK